MTSTKPAVLIRPSNAADVPTITQLIRALAVYEKLEHLVQATEQKIEQDLFGPRPFAECVLATVEEQGQERVIGFALFFHNYSTFLTKPGLWLEDLFVLPEYRGVGAGKALLQHLSKLAVERDCGRYEWSVLDWNTPSIEFYRRMGATVMPDWRICRVTGDALTKMADL